MAIITRLVSTAVVLLAALTASVLSHPEPRAPSGASSKYFREPGGSLARMHYDLRYFKEEVAYNERSTILRSLIRSYLETMQAKGVETWLAHGTLLGWWWNAQVMPWDYDLDVQVSIETMEWLAANLNGTEYTHAPNQEMEMPPIDASHNRTYLLDINPHYIDLTSGGGHNIIDGRWIDMDSGMFVDITVLREHPFQQGPGVWSCKNGHQYTAQDLWPLRVTEFVGTHARIPHNVEQILSKEYSLSSLEKETHEYHHWNHDLKQWVMDDPEQRGRAKYAGALHKKQQLENQGRL
ncbi:hypothetical protein LMH87_003291 [Akanthomyces muscarius]|uniref:LicD/FKTN/FKRP nucleotidyltransferase domain-containing protein n=1 Tax=Akanthomyces muscarius TaxID=2231603 RepID=A0A9W8Q3B0_AKAMU|nr:hypothetical protein LMH87_003291 [Akanthomyces muscarius]KAJ4144407.1 hypothetical protein LMH87_003291 [Akanthomyces muscarius]